MTNWLRATPPQLLRLPHKGSKLSVVKPITGITAGVTTQGGLQDITPTLLLLLGFPRSLEMKGHPLRSCLRPDAVLGGDLLAPVASYGKPMAPAEAGSSFDPEVLEKLRSLGYIR